MKIKEYIENNCKFCSQYEECSKGSLEEQAKICKEVNKEEVDIFERRIIIEELLEKMNEEIEMKARGFNTQLKGGNQYGNKKNR